MNDAWVDRLLDLGLDADAAIWAAVRHNEDWQPSRNFGHGAFHGYCQSNYRCGHGDQGYGDGNGCGSGRSLWIMPVGVDGGAGEYVSSLGLADMGVHELFQDRLARAISARRAAYERRMDRQAD